MKRHWFLLLSIAALLAVPRPFPAADKKESSASAPAPKLSDEEQEQFLRKAKISKTSGTKKGVTNTTRVTMSDGNITHDAHVQCIDEAKHDKAHIVGPVQ